MDMMIRRTSDLAARPSDGRWSFSLMLAGLEHLPPLFTLWPDE
jgi:hypothetical protein